MRWNFTTASLAIAIGVLFIIGLWHGSPSGPPVQVTGLLHYSGAQGEKDITLTILNPSEVSSFCQAVVTVTRDGTLLKSVRRTIGTLMPNEERMVTLNVVIPEGAEYTVTPHCVPQD